MLGWGLTEQEKRCHTIQYKIKKLYRDTTQLDAKLKKRCKCKNMLLQTTSYKRIVLNVSD